MAGDSGIPEDMDLEVFHNIRNLFMTSTLKRKLVYSHVVT